MTNRLIAAFALIAVGVAGCTTAGSGSPSTAPATPTSVATTPTAPTAPVSSASTKASPSVATTGPNVRRGEKPPVLSKAGDENSPLGSITYASYWMRSLDWAYATMSSVLPRTVYAASCTSCARFVNFDIDKVAAQDRHYDGGRIGIFSTAIQPNNHHFGSTAVVDVSVQQKPFRIVGPSGHVYERTAVSAVTFRVWLRWSGARWSVVDWKTVASR